MEFVRYTPEVEAVFEEVQKEYNTKLRRSTPMTAEEKALCFESVKVLYRLQDLPEPKILFAASPLEGWNLSGENGLHSVLFPYLYNDTLCGEFFNSVSQIVFAASAGGNASFYHYRGVNTFGFFWRYQINIISIPLCKYCLDHIDMSVELQEYLQAYYSLCMFSSNLLMSKNCVVIEDFPSEYHIDDQELLHNETGPAIAWADGFSMYYWHDVILPSNVITDPASITLDQIENEANAEIRRIMVERYGLSRYLLACGTVIDDAVDEVGSPLRLYCRDWSQSVPYGDPNRMKITEDEPIVMLEMTNSTVDPDGTVRTYMRRVPPRITSAIEARNWVCGLDVDSRIDVQT